MFYSRKIVRDYTFNILEMPFLENNKVQKNTEDKTPEVPWISILENFHSNLYYHRPLPYQNDKKCIFLQIPRKRTQHENRKSQGTQLWWSRKVQWKREKEMFKDKAVTKS